MKYFTVVLLVFFGVGVMGQVVEPNDDVNTKPLNFDFGCTVEVDLEIYSANSLVPISESEEFKVGATGVANEEDLIKVEFLEIPDVASGEVIITFELKFSLNSSYDIWNEGFNNLIGSVSYANDILIISKDASELPFTVLLQTPGESYTYRDIFVQMDYDGVVDRARATVYGENNNSVIEIEPLDANVPSHQWTPSNLYTGSNPFISNMNDALLFINNNGLGNYQLTSNVGGDIINDFLDNGLLSFVDVQIAEQEWGNTIISSDGGQILMSNGRGAMKIFEETNGTILQEEGYIPPFIFVIHELAHIWLQKYDPILDNQFSTQDAALKEALYPIYGMSGHNYTDSFEHDLILEKLENPACEQFMFGVRKYYDNALYTTPTEQAQILTIQQSQLADSDSDLFYKSTNSLETTPE